MSLRKKKSNYYWILIVAIHLLIFSTSWFLQLADLPQTLHRGYLKISWLEQKQHISVAIFQIESPVMKLMCNYSWKYNVGLLIVVRRKIEILK